MSLKNKRILITAGPTQVPLDSVRVISNIATGRTGIILAEKLQNLGAKVTLLLSAQEPCCLNKKIKLIRFSFFDDLKNMAIRELKSKRYDIVIHSAAVSDYRPAGVYRKKVKSGRGSWQIKLVPTPKIIDLIRKAGRHLFIVGFKFEPAAAKGRLIKEARKLIRRAGLDLAVANTLKTGRYLAYIVGSANQIYGPLLSKEDMAGRLAGLVGRNYGRAEDTRQA